MHLAFAFRLFWDIHLTTSVVHLQVLGSFLSYDTGSWIVDEGDILNLHFFHCLEKCQVIALHFCTSVFARCSCFFPLMQALGVASCPWFNFSPSLRLCQLPKEADTCTVTKIAFQSRIQKKPLWEIYSAIGGNGGRQVRAIPMLLTFCCILSNAEQSRLVEFRTETGCS